MEKIFWKIGLWASGLYEETRERFVCRNIQAFNKIDLYALYESDLESFQSRRSKSPNPTDLQVFHRQGNKDIYLKYNPYNLEFLIFYKVICVFIKKIFRTPYKTFYEDTIALDQYFTQFQYRLAHVRLFKSPYRPQYLCYN